MPLVLAGATSGQATIQATDAQTVTMTLPATSGTLVTTGGAQTIEFADGSASAPSITNSGDTNTGMFFPAADTVAASAGGTERMRIDSAGNVGVRSSGVTTPTYDFSTLGEGLWSRYWDNSGTRTADIVAIGNTPAGATQIMRFLTNTGGSPGTAVERGRFDASGNFQFNSGYGSVATAYGCRAWVNFNGEGVVAIRSSGNVSSITDNATGNYTVNFTTAMPDANYSTTVSYSQNYGTERCVGAQINQGASGNEQAPTTSAFRFVTTGAINEYDSKYVCVAIFR
jgi:hypothetical protein